jgi:hypothetical protein
MVAPALWAIPAPAQTAASEQQVLQVLLTEIHELRKDIQNTAANIQRVQIAMYRVGAQAAIVEKVSQRLELARNECKQNQALADSIQAQLRLQEEVLRNAQDAQVRKRVEEQIQSLRESVEPSAREAQSCLAEQLETENQLRTEQAKMSELEDRLDRLDRTLEGGGVTATR